jgi:hypothetical protein
MQDLGDHGFDPGADVGLSAAESGAARAISADIQSLLCRQCGNGHSGLDIIVSNKHNTADSCINSGLYNIFFTLLFKTKGSIKTGLSFASVMVYSINCCIYFYIKCKYHDIVPDKNTI